MVDSLVALIDICLVFETVEKKAVVKVVALVVGTFVR